MSYQLIEALENRRLLSAGTLDTAFGSGGKVSVKFDTAQSAGQAFSSSMRVRPERAPGGLLPALAAAHRAERKRAEDRYPVTAVRAVVLTLRARPCGEELDVPVVDPSRLADLL